MTSSINNSIVLRHIFVVLLYLGIFQKVLRSMSSTEEDNALLCQSQEVGLKESEAEAESVVESVVRGEERVEDGGDKDENDEAGDAGHGDEVEETGEEEAGGLPVPGFGEKDVPSGDDDEEIGSCVATGSFHSATSDDRHEMDYLAKKKSKLF